MSVAVKWLELAKEERKRARERDGRTQEFKTNRPPEYKVGGREMNPETQEIIKLAKQGKDKEIICKRMSFKGVNRKRVTEVLWRYEAKIKESKNGME